MSPKIEWEGDDRFRLEGFEFHAHPFGGGGAPARGFTLLKNRPLVDAYVDLARTLRPERIVELGVFRGGSVALLELLTTPQRLLAFDIRPDPIPELTAFLAGRAATDRVRVSYGVDQSDGAAIVGVLHEELGPEPVLDLVIDDASHELDLTRRSFNLLFPYLREGGVYVVEDWGWGHFAFARERAGPSLAKLMVEMVLSLPYAERLIDQIVIDRHLALITRGSAEIDPATFDLGDHVSPRGAQLLSVVDEDPRLLDGS
jgi:predicted O-methyltransferase YrrM